MIQLLNKFAIGLAVAFAPAVASAWTPEPWLADLEQIRTAIDTQYPNQGWLTGQREVSLDRWFSRATEELRKSQDDISARAALDRLIERFNDGHLKLSWPSISGPGVKAAPEPAPATVAAFCGARGYDEGQTTKGTAASLPGFRPLEAGNPFRPGLVEAGGASVGILRIGVFSPQGFPVFCERAVANTSISIATNCDDACEDRLLTEAYALMTRALIETVERLRGAGAQVLLVDVTRNGGGSEWAETAARIVAPVPLRSAPVGVLRSEA